MSWLHHPRYARQRDALIELFQDKIYHFPTLRLVVFLCGGANSPVRERIAQYLRTKTKTLVFYADDVWARLAREDLNALQMEDRSEEHTSELQSPMYLVCRLLLE